LSERSYNGAMTEQVYRIYVKC